VLKALIFFDFRPLHGKFSLADALKDSFLSGLPTRGSSWPHGEHHHKEYPAIGFLKSFVVEKSGEHKDELNLKIKGIAPLVDVVRFFCP